MGYEKAWLNEEIIQLKSLFPESNKETLLDAFQSRTWTSLVVKANRLNIPRRFRWSNKRIVVKIPREDAIWLACAIDTEGSISLIKAKKIYNGNQKIYFNPKISMKNTSLEWINHYIKLSNVKCNFRQEKYDSKYKKMYSVHISQLQSYALLKEILPYFIIKKEQAKLLIEFLDIRSKIVWGDLRKWDYTPRQYEIYNELRNLNSCGRWPK